MQYDMLIAGDAILATKSGNLPPFSSEIEDLIGRTPYSMINLETVLCRDGRLLEKAIVLRADPTMAKYLQVVGIKAVNLANNHTFDYGPDGFRQTLSVLENSGVGYFGVTETGIQSPYLFQANGLNIAVLGYTIGGTGDSDIGVARLDERRIKGDIADLKSRNIDRIIVNLHWGEEYVAYPSPEQQRIARRLIDAGADVIVGHHPHVVQGIEKYKNGAIFYSLGNFNFVTSNIMPRFFACDRWGLMLLLRFPSHAPVDFLCIPIVMNISHVCQRQKRIRPFLRI